MIIERSTDKSASLHRLFFMSLLVCITFLNIAPAQSSSKYNVLIRNITLIDGTGQMPQVGIDVLLGGDKIISIGNAIKQPAGALVIDGSGKYVIPGLIDTHVHLQFPVVFQISEEEKQSIRSHTPSAFLYNGVTTVLNVSSNAEWIWDLRKKQRAGYLVGPRIYALGHAFSPEGGWGSRHGGSLTDPESARKQVQEYIAADTDGLKIIVEDGLGEGSGLYNEMPDDMLQAIVDVAKEENVPMFVHAIGLPEYHRAAKVKPRAIIHGLEDELPVGDSIIEELVANEIAIVPTLSLFKSFLSADPHGGKALDHPVLEGSVPAFLLKRMRRADYMNTEREHFTKVARMKVYDWARRSNPVFCDNVRKMHEAGVKMGVGTDAGGTVGFNYQGYNTPWEVKNLVECGLNPMEALVAATRNGAEIIGVDDQLGTIEVGKQADLLILSSNPLENIENIRQIEWIIQNGTVHPRTDFAYKEQ
ncbi:MAG: amidohydrolase family protein [Gammaproteobacteria bacterium]|nr:amidohydrolase family protein [Gammaproteobacteria bacterium]